MSKKHFDANTSNITDTVDKLLQAVINRRCELLDELQKVEAAIKDLNYIRSNHSIHIQSGG